MNPVQRPDSIEAATYVGLLRRRWLIVLAFTLVGLVGAFAYVVVAPKTYAATAAVYVKPTGADQSSGQLQNARTSGAVNMDNEAQLVTSANVAAIAGKALKSPDTPWKLSQEVAAAVPANSQVLSITCSAPTAEGAAACANAFAAAYLQNRSATATASINAQLHAIASKMSALQKSEASLSAKMGTLKRHSPTRVSDAAQLSSYKSQLHSFNLLEGTLNGELANSSGGWIITRATPPGKPSSPKKLLILPSGLVLGLLIGLGVAFLVDRRDKRIHTSADVERFLDLPVMIDLPPFGHQVSLASPRSRTGQSFTELGQAVGAALGEGNHVLLVAGGTPTFGRSVIAANLAATLARTHSEVVLICADLKDTVAPQLLGVGESGEGLAELVAGNAAVKDVVRGPAGMPGLWVITPGADPSLAVYHMQHDRARALISQLRKDASFVVIEAQATEQGADTFALGEFADAAVVAVETKGTDRIEAAECVRRVRQLRTPVLGAVVSEAPRGRVTVRPPRQQPQPRLDIPDEVQGDGRGAGPPLSGVPPVGTPDRRPRKRPVHSSHDGYSDRADRVPGG
jgi:capsular polysaccharide biosynthesis protein